MDKLKQIMYGVSDFPLKVREGACVFGHGPYFVRYDALATLSASGTSFP